MHPLVILLVLYALLSIPLGFIRSHWARFAVGALAGLLISIHGWPDVPSPFESTTHLAIFLGKVSAFIAKGLAMVILATITQMIYRLIRTGRITQTQLPMNAFDRLIIVLCLVFYTVAGFYIQHAAEASEKKKARQSVSQNSTERFKKAFIRSFTQSCIKKQLQNEDNRRAGISPTQIESYCACSASRLTDAITVSEIEYALKNSFQLPKSRNDKILSASNACLAEVFGVR